jgi:hypothetical protein
VPGAVANGQPSSGQHSQTVVIISGNPDLDLGAAWHGIELRASIVESKNLLPGKTFAGCSVRAVLRHSPAVAPASAADREASGLDGHGRSARAGMVVSTAEVPNTVPAIAAQRRRLIQLRLGAANLGREDMAIPFVGKWP